MHSRVVFFPIGGMVVALVMLGAVFALVWLLSSQKGRAVAKVLVGVLAVVLFMGFFTLIAWRSTARVETATEELTAPDIALERRLAETPATPTEDQKSGGDEADTAAEAKGTGTDGSEGQPTTGESAPSPAASDKAAITAAAADRPDWVEAASSKVGAAYQMTVKVGPYETRVECDRDLPAHLQAAVDRYAAAYLGHDTDGKVRLPLDYLQGKTVKAEWEEPTKVLITPKEKPPEYVPMILLHVLLEFDHEANARIQDQWDKVIVNDRLLGVGGLTAAVLLLLSAVYGYLKIDLATGGKYRGRLRLAAAGLILLVLVAGFAFN